MKYFLMHLILLAAGSTFAQSGFPGFLRGTWKVENEETYEHWDSLNEQRLKGFAYEMKDRQMKVSEYLDITRKNKDVTYTASVVGQNKGKDVTFKLMKADSVFSFENPGHDFPKKVLYKKVSDTEIYVEVSDGKDKKFSYYMQKLHVNKIAKDPTNANPNYDKALAQKLGADDYGMKAYILVILKTGTNQTSDKSVISESFKGHMANINRLVEEGKLIVAGPMGKNDKTYRGIFILKDIATLDEAKALLQTDPAVKAGILDAEVYNWYGSAALPEYLPFSDKIWKVQP
ncbi:YciI family protein [Chitinophaga sp. S165]|uniref:YciI family protein n=1 Tax=Chitinophaga sp. S165 TaxID=2135462 RepID=UPI000D71B937|nr:DUF6265 family protein [Chitinophaga sp. S165]PWV57042.1 uncharacterized protein YciI [Chitinophaga sp. S165]